MGYHLYPRDLLEEFAIEIFNPNGDPDNPQGNIGNFRMVEHLSEGTHEVFDNNSATSEHNGGSLIEGDTPGYNFTNSLSDIAYPDGSVAGTIELPSGEVIVLRWPSEGEPHPAYSEMYAAFGSDFDPSINRGPVIRDIQHGSSNRRSTIDILHGGVGRDLLYGRTNDDILYGDEDNDYLNGGTGNDTLYGGSGHDKLEGGAGADMIDGGEGSDIASYASSSSAVTIDLSKGTATGGHATGDTLVSIEHVEGAMGGSTITGNDQNNILSGAKRSDLYEGAFYSEFCEVLFAHYPREVLSSLPADHPVRTSEIHAAYAAIDNNYIKDSTFSDVLYGGKGDDTLNGYDGNDKLYGGEGEDVLNGGVGADILDGGADRDGVTYKDSTGGVLVNLQDNLGQGFEAEGDTFTSIEDIEGSAHDDQLFGDSESNRLFGEKGNDVISGGNGRDYLFGGKGKDVLTGGGGADYFDGGEDNDTVSYKHSAGPVLANLQANEGKYNDAEGDTFISIENVEGSEHGDVIAGNDSGNKLYGLNGDDTIYGFAGNDNLFGGNGNDTLKGGAGADALDGGADNDTVSYKESAGPVLVNLQDNIGQHNDAEGDTFASIENVEGSDGGDLIVGNDVNNRLFSGEGDDSVHGLGGNDIFDGGIGENKLFGGLGDDTYVIRDGYGYNFIYENSGEGNDDARFLDRSTSDISLLAKYDGDDLIIGFNGNAELIHFVDWYATDGTYTVENFYFNDGSGNYVTATAEALAAAATEITPSA